jgi:hypothetical protein
MARQTFKGGSVLMTGDDMMAALEAAYNRRGLYETECSYCIHEDSSDAEYDEFCEGCSISDTDLSCSCHINPPCSKCVESAFEPSSNLVNYQQHKNGKKKWECFKADKEVCDKLQLIEDAKLELSAEILTTGEVAIYIDDGIDFGNNEAIEICERVKYKQVMCKMIMDYSIQSTVV